MHRPNLLNVLRFRDVALNRDPPWFDIPNRMSHTNHNTDRPGPGPQRPHAPPSPADQLAHELANLLDGSLRHLGIAINTLREDTPTKPGRPGSEKAPQDTPQALLARLQTTDRAMRQMASLIHAWMKYAPKPREMFDQSQTLTQMLDQAIELHQPSAAHHEIELSLTLGIDVAEIPAGPIFPIVANALRNSIEAIAEADPPSIPGPHWIDITAWLQAEQLHLTVSDNGPGPAPSVHDAQGRLRLGQTTKPHGHGLGLTLSDQIARSLDGTLELSPRPPRGAQLTLRCPLTSLTPHGQIIHPADAT